jgi:cytosine permease
MATTNTTGTAVQDDTGHADIGHDDYSLRRVPNGARYSWGSVAVQRFGQVSALSQFLLGATLGVGMKFWPAVGAITLGAVILEVVAIFVGIAGMREGLSTSLLARWSGFGRYGSALIGLIITISLVGWFGIQNAVFASGLVALIGGPPLWLWSVITGLLVTGIVLYGFTSMTWTAYVTVPLFIGLCVWSISKELTKHSLGALVSSAPPGVHLTLAAGTTLVAGGFIVGSVITPDMTRFNRSIGDVVKQTVVGITLGEYCIGLIGVLLAHAVGSDNVLTIVYSTSGAVGTIILIAATLKINDWNLYSSSLGFVNLADQVFRRKLGRGVSTLVIGVIGTILSAAGILNHFTGFLDTLGVAIPPIAGIMVAEYFIVRRWRPALAAGRADGALPASAPAWVPATLAVWVAASLIGEYVHWGIPALNALAVSFIGYLLAGRLGLTRGFGQDSGKAEACVSA